MKKNLNIQEEWNQIEAGFGLHIAMPQFSIPENYFNLLPNEIIAGIKSSGIAEPTLAKINMPYQIPEHYFEQLPSQITVSIQHVEKVLQFGFNNIEPKANPFEVPKDYFENIATSVLKKINAEVGFEEELSESPLLAALKGKNPYETPVEIKVNIPQVAQVEVKKTSKWDVPMVVNKRLRMSNIAVAASVALFFVFGAAWLHLGKNETIKTSNMAVHTLVNPQVKAEKLLAEIPDNEIEEYLNQNIEQFNEFALETNVASHKTNSVRSIEQELNNISKEEIEAYLNGGI